MQQARGRDKSSSSSTMDGMAYREQRTLCNSERSLRNQVRCASTMRIVRNVWRCAKIYVHERPLQIVPSVTDWHVTCRLTIPLGSPYSRSEADASTWSLPNNHLLPLPSTSFRFCLEANVRENSLVSYLDCSLLAGSFDDGHRMSLFNLRWEKNFCLSMGDLRQCD